MFVLAAVLLLVLLFIAGLGRVAIMLETWEEYRKLPKGDPNEILDRRFARGEIAEGEYIRAKHLLTYGPPLEID